MPLPVALQHQTCSGKLSVCIHAESPPCVPACMCAFPLCPTSSSPHVQAGWVPRLEAHHACLNLFACVATTSFLGNLLKSQVLSGRGKAGAFGGSKEAKVTGLATLSWG